MHDARGSAARNIGLCLLGLGLFLTAAIAEPWQPAQLVEPDQFAKSLSSTPGLKPLVFYVGPQVLYRSAHIPGARFIGPGFQPAGLERLQQELERLPRDGEIVLYCGCCPWDDCPNIRPAFVAAKKMGFSKLRVLHLAHSFKQDWIDRGFPIQRGE